MATSSSASNRRVAHGEQMTADPTKHCPRYASARRKGLRLASKSNNGSEPGDTGTRFYKRSAAFSSTQKVLHWVVVVLLILQEFVFDSGMGRYFHAHADGKQGA